MNKRTFWQVFLRRRKPTTNVEQLRKLAFHSPPMTKDEKREFQRQVAEVKVQDDRKRAGEGGGLF